MSTVGASRVLIATLAVLAVAAPTAAGLEAPSVDMPSLLCTATEAASAGYLNAEPWRPASAEKRGTGLMPQRTDPRWWIDPIPSTIRVRVTRGSMQQREEPAIFTVERAPLGVGWLLMRADRPPGVWPETLTITQATLHLVYSTQQVTPTDNRVVVWVGQCRPAP